MSAIPTLTAARLTLRPLRKDDVDAFHRILGEPDVLRYFPRPEPPPRERVSEIIAAQGRHWAERGYGWWALRAVLEYVFDRLGKRRVYGSVDPRNVRSLALLERAGLRREAHFRESLWFKGAWADDVICAMLVSEWRSARRAPDAAEGE